MKALGEIPVLVRICEFMARVPLLVGTSHAVDCILGTTFLDRHVKAILLPQRKVVFHKAPPVVLIGTTLSRHYRKMASRSIAQQLPPSDKPECRQVALPANTPSRKIRLIRGATIPPMTQALVRAATPVGGYVFTELPKNRAQECDPHGTRGHGCRPRKPFSVMLSNFGHRAVHIPKHTVVELALPSPTHILTLGESAPEAPEAKEGGGIFDSNTSTAEDDAGEAANNCTDKGGAEQATPPRAPVGADAPDKPEDTAAPEGDPNFWYGDVHIGAEDEEIRSEVVEVLHEFMDKWTRRLGKSGPRSTALSSSPGLARFIQTPYRAGPTPTGVATRTIAWAIGGIVTPLTTPIFRDCMFVGNWARFPSAEFSSCGSCCDGPLEAILRSCLEGVTLVSPTDGT